MFTKISPKKDMLKLSLVTRNPIVTGLTAFVLSLVTTMALFYVVGWSYFFNAVHGTFHNVIVAGLIAVVLVEFAASLALAALGMAVLVLGTVLGAVALLIFDR